MDSAQSVADSAYLNKNALNRARFNYQLPIVAAPKKHACVKGGYENIFREVRRQANSQQPKALK